MTTEPAPMSIFILKLSASKREIEKSTSKTPVQYSFIIVQHTACFHNNIKQMAHAWGITAWVDYGEL